MSSVKIRLATLEDLPILKEFEQGIILAERPFDTTLKQDPIHYYDFEALIKSDKACVIVASMDEKLVGSGMARIDLSKPYKIHEKHAYLGFMFTMPEHRGQGINRKIMDALKNWAAEKEISELKLEVYDENQSAITAYQKAGFSKNLVEMRMNLSRE